MNLWFQLFPSLFLFRHLIIFLPFKLMYSRVSFPSFFLSLLFFFEPLTYSQLVYSNSSECLKISTFSHNFPLLIFLSSRLVSGTVWTSFPDTRYYTSAPMYFYTISHGFCMRCSKFRTHQLKNEKSDDSRKPFKFNTLYNICFIYREEVKERLFFWSIFRI